uniref:Aminopeptidase N-like N-terminal domain-containing protein n=1 Tax=Parascaris equorum TaxID=6256 RepID=A0A914RMZ1_PAREQ
MVPCFDEPEFKAVWKVKIIHPSGTVAISNGIELKDAIKTFLGLEVVSINETGI